MQGVAEVLPVSSSAQLQLLPWLLGWPADPVRTSTTFAAGLHAGSCAGLLVTAHADVRALATTADGRRTTALVAAGTLPAALAGALLAEKVEARLDRPGVLAGVLAGGGVLMWLADRRPQDVARVGGWQAAGAALAQVVALIPGVSRSGATLTVLRAMRVTRATAQHYSLLMSLPVTAGAAGLTLLRADRSTLTRLAGPLSVAAPVAAVAAGATHLRREHQVRSVTGPTLYRLGLALVVGARLRRRTDPATDPARDPAAGGQRR